MEKINIQNLECYSFLFSLKFEPMIEKGHAELVHHVLVYGCFTDRFGQYTTKDLEGHSNHCFTSNDERMKALLKCDTKMFVWSRGGKVSIKTFGRTCF